MIRQRYDGLPPVYHVEPAPYRPVDRPCYEERPGRSRLLLSLVSTVYLGIIAWACWWAQ